MTTTCSSLLTRASSSTLPISFANMEKVDPDLYMTLVLKLVDDALMSAEDKQAKVRGQCNPRRTMTGLCPSLRDFPSLVCPALLPGEQMPLKIDKMLKGQIVKRLRER